jgi:Ca-activated chloride channel family protein
MTDGEYKPDVYAPSNYAWGEMLKAQGFSVVTLSERILGNTAGILMEKATHEEFMAKYKEVTVDKVLEASLAGDLTFAYTNPFTSSTGLNIFTAMLHAFDPDNPLSAMASEKLLEYQRQSPPVAYTTAVLREQASKGVIKSMVMEEQAYHNTPELKDYIYTPQGIRHDHPVYTFDYVAPEKQAAAKLFVDYCLNGESQKLGSEKGFNLHDEYQGQDPGLDGAGFLAAQKLWKQSKDGGRPIIAVFVADVSGSMDGQPLNALKESLVNTSTFIGDSNYVGLVTYSSEVNINLDIAQFDDTQRAYFSGAVKALTASGGTATYDAVLVGLDMLLKKQEEVPDAKLMLFVLSDGQQNEGYRLDRITPIVGGLQVPVYSIGYNLENGSEAEQELSRLSRINEAVTINAQSEDLVNQLRNLFNVQM